MRAYQYTNTAPNLHSNLHLNPSTPVPIRKSDQHLIRVLATSLNPMDIKVPETTLVHRLLFLKPCIPCFDVVGEIIEAAEGSSLKTGHPVFGLSSSSLQGGAVLAEYAVVPADVMTPVPKELGTADAASIPMAGLTAYQSTVPFIKPGYRVFINGGSGGVGTFGIQFAKVVGAHVTTSCSRRNLEVCRKLGADRVLDYTERSVVEQLREEAREYGPFGLVVDNVCNDFHLYWRMHEFSKKEARYVMVGWGPSIGCFKFTLQAWLTPGLLGGGRRGLQIFVANNKTEDLGKIASWVVEGKVKPVIDSKFSMEHAVDAFRKLESGRAVGKIIVEVAEK